MIEYEKLPLDGLDELEEAELIAPEKPIVLVDMDGTLADCSERRAKLEERYCPTCCAVVDWTHACQDTRLRKNWPAFFAHCEDDKPIEAVVRWVRALPPDYEVWVVSGRPMDYCHEGTVQWLEAQAIPYSKLFMREARDTRADNIVKQEILDRYIPKERVAFVIDDRNSVCEMWRKNGLKVFQVADGDF